MRNKKILLGTLVMVFGMVIIGCRSLHVEHVAQFTVASTMSVDLSRIGEFSRTAQVVTGESRRFQNIFMQWRGDVDRRMERAIDNAIRSVPGGVAMVDVRMEQSLTTRGFRNRQDDRFIVSGTVLIDPRVISYAGSNEPLLSVQTIEGEMIALIPITSDDLRLIMDNLIFTKSLLDW
ncbi:MAG: hypothetical protein LBG93_00270 [Treponema sp.]|jgi:hypothetical protein|nr:hypothetical protein [Treponema sp.]